jgi:ankyrin repeat protein
MRKRTEIEWKKAFYGASALLLLPALVAAQATAKEPPEKPQVVDMGTFKVSAPSGRDWEVEPNLENNAVLFSKFRQGILTSMFNQERGMMIWVKATIGNIYGWTVSEEYIVNELWSRYEDIEFPPGAKCEREVVEWDGKKLYTLRAKDYPEGVKRDSILFLYFPPGFSKSHMFFEFDFLFVRGSGFGGVKLYDNPGLEPVRAVIASLEIVDPLQAIPGPHGDLLRAAAAGNAEVVVQVLESGADINAISPERSALSTAASHGRREIVDLLLVRGAALDGVDERTGITPLLAALIGREPEIAAFFIEKGADVNRKVDAGGGVDVTPLMFATAIKNMDLIRAIADAGADLGARTGLGEPALILAADNGWVEGAALFLERGADVNARMKNGWTALMRAAMKGHTDVVLLLLENKADIALKAADDGMTALMCAVYSGEVDIVKTLIERGADINAHRTGFGDTALHVAAFYDRRDIARTLIEAGADRNARDSANATALKVAKKQKHPEMVRLLQTYGVK